MAENRVFYLVIDLSSMETYRSEIYDEAVKIAGEWIGTAPDRQVYIMKSYAKVSVPKVQVDLIDPPKLDLNDLVKKWNPPKIGDLEKWSPQWTPTCYGGSVTSVGQ